jgi:hypothetical protein
MSSSQFSFLIEINNINPYVLVSAHPKGWWESFPVRLGRLQNKQNKLSP